MLTWRVWLTQPKKRPVKVQADYFRIDNGVLVFRKARATPQSYPEAVTVFASGAWSRLEAVRD